PSPDRRPDPADTSGETAQRLAQLESWQRMPVRAAALAWAECIAYADWLAHVTGHAWRLPSEAGWGKAARGTRGGPFPGGSQYWDNQTSKWAYHGGPVGDNPGAASPYGMQDYYSGVSGGYLDSPTYGATGEWCSSLLKPYPYIATDGREDLS